MLQDLRFALRLLGRSRGYAAAAILTLALGIGANTAIFSIVDGAILRPLPYPHPDRLVMFGLHNASGGRRVTGMTPRDFLDWRDQQQVFDFLVGTGGGTVRLLGGTEPEDLSILRVTAGFFEAFGAAPALGRLFVRDDEVPGADRKVIVSDTFWRERLGQDPAAIGRTLRLDDEPYEIVGVLPGGFEYPVWFKAYAIFVPRAFTAEDRQHGVNQSGMLGTIGRLKPGVRIADAARRMTELQTRLDVDHAIFNKGLTQVELTPLVERLVFDARPWMLMLLGAVALVLLVACANVANLVLAHGSTRVRELTVRAALGADRLRIARQMLIETLLLASLGGLAGLLAAYWGLTVLRGTMPASIPRAADIAIDLRVLAFTSAVTLVTGLVCGLLPAVHGSRVSLVSGLRDGSGATAAPGRQRIRLVLAGAEIALAVMLVIGAGLFIVSFARVVGVDRGFDGSGVLTAAVSAPRTTTPTAATRAYFFDLKAAVERVPGIDRVAIVQYDAPLLAGSSSFPLTVVGRPAPPKEGAESIRYRAFSAGVFDLLRIPVRRGRLWTERDTDATPLLAVINEAAARRFWKNEDPIGQRIVINKKTYEIAGVVGDIRYVSLAEAPQPEAYLAYEQMTPTSATLLLRAHGDAVSVSAAVKSAIWGVNPNQAVEMGSIAANDRRGTARRRFNMLLMSVFALVALAVAATGIYGVLSFFVTARTREMGVRLALGARAGQVAGLILRQGAGVIVSGVVAGVAGAWWLGRTIESFLFGVQPREPSVFAMSALLLLLVAFVACWFPARRAARVDPIAALRAE